MVDVSNIIIGGLAFVTVSTAFVDQDRRGLAFFTEPEIFAVEQSVDNAQPTEFPIVWGEPLGSTSNRVSNPFGSPRTNRQVAEAPLREDPFITRNPVGSSNGDSGAPTSLNADEISSGATQLAQTNTNARQTPASADLDRSVPAGVATPPVPQVVPVIAPSVPGFFPGSTFIVTPGANVPPGSVTPSTPTTPATPVDPIIPAVPEPSSWLMMILGVGILGLMLRYRREDLDIDTSPKALTA